MSFSISQQDHFNRYWYANGNPYKHVDPDGRDPVSIAMGYARMQELKRTDPARAAEIERAGFTVVAIGATIATAPFAGPIVGRSMLAVADVPPAVVAGESALAAAPASSAMAAPVTATVTATAQAVTRMTTVASQAATKGTAAALMELGADLGAGAAAARNVAGAERVVEMTKAAAIQTEIRGAINAAMKSAQKGAEVVRQCLEGKCF